VNYYSVIYEAIDDVKQAVSGLLKPEVKEQIVGLAEVAKCSARASSHRRRLPGGRGFIKRAPGARASATTWSSTRASSTRCVVQEDDVARSAPGTECGIGVVKYKTSRGRPDRVLRRFEVAAQRVSHAMAA